MSRKSFLSAIGNKMMRLNKRTDLFRRGKEYAFFNALNLEVSYFDVGLNPVVRRLNSPLDRDGVQLLYEKHVKGLKGRAKQKASREFWRLLEDLRENKLLVPANFSEEREVARLQKDLLKKIGTSKKTLMIIPSFDCNYRCKYCFYFGKASPPQGKLSWEKAKLGIDWFFNQLDTKQGSRKRIQFYGGEPLLDYDLIRDIFSYISQKNAKRRWKKYSFDLQVTTNGSMIDERWIKLFKKYGVIVTVSLDGKRDINDRMRVDISGRGGTDATVRGISLLNEHGIRPNISIALNKYNIGSLAEQIRWIEKKFEINTIGFGHFVPPDKKAVRIITKKKLIDECSKAFDRLCRWDLYEVELMKRWRHFINKTIPPLSCPGHFSQAVLLPDGRIGPCQLYAGSGRHFEALKSPNQKLDKKLWGIWRASSHLLSDKCLYECNLFRLCGGACPYVAELKTGAFTPYDESRCAFYKMLLEKYIWYSRDWK